MCRRKHERYRAIRFDLTAPVRSQFREGKEAFRNEQVRRGINEIRTQLSPASRDKWIRHLRVLDAKEQDATHAEIYEHLAREQAADDDALDEFYRFGSQPKALVSQWLKQAQEVMEKVSRFL